MKVFLILVLACMLSGCVTDVSHEPPHNKLTGTIWRLKTDAYVLEYGDNRGVFLITPNTERFGAYREFSISGKPYDEKNVGRKVVGLKIVGGLRAGETLKVVRVLKVPNIEMGTIYHPKMIPETASKWTGDKELDGENLYYGRDKDGKFFDEQGILNPEYVEIVTVETNASSSGSAKDSPVSSAP